MKSQDGKKELFKYGVNKTWVIFHNVIFSKNYFFKDSINNNSNTQCLSSTYDFAGIVLRILHKLVHFILARALGS
jgi:hypothetical protein